MAIRPLFAASGQNIRKNFPKSLELEKNSIGFQCVVSNGFNFSDQNVYAFTNATNLRINMFGQTDYFALKIGQMPYFWAIALHFPYF